MIQEIPYKYDPAYKKDKKPEMSDYLLHYEYNKVMLFLYNPALQLPDKEFPCQPGTHCVQCGLVP